MRVQQKLCLLVNNFEQQYKTKIELIDVIVNIKLTIIPTSLKYLCSLFTINLIILFIIFIISIIINTWNIIVNIFTISNISVRIRLINNNIKVVIIFLCLKLNTLLTLSIIYLYIKKIKRKPKTNKIIYI